MIKIQSEKITSKETQVAKPGFGQQKGNLFIIHTVFKYFEIVEIVMSRCYEPESKLVTKTRLLDHLPSEEIVLDLDSQAATASLF